MATTYTKESVPFVKECFVHQTFNISVHLNILVNSLHPLSVSTFLERKKKDFLFDPKVIMSPTKPVSAPVRKMPTTGSFIPRRVKTTSKISTKSITSSSSTTDPLKKKVPVKTSNIKSSNTKTLSIFSDKTTTLAPTSTVSLFSNIAEANKENMPCGPLRSSVNRANNNGGSPIRLRSGISKNISQKSTHKKKTFGYNRIPLRELDTQEVFERDEAVLGDLRRRRSGEHSGAMIEVESVLAYPSPNTANATTARASSSKYSATGVTVTTTATGYYQDDSADEREQEIRTKLDVILASTSGDSKGKGKIITKAIRQRSVHPAVRQMSPALSPYRSEASAPSSPVKSQVDSPLRTKAVNKLLAEKKLVATVAGKEGEKTKKVIITTSAATSGALKKKSSTTRKVGTSSLRRAAGGATTSTSARDPSRPPLALTGGRVMGLEGMRNMR
ncbi:uncharacterized protein LAJ45_04066 [Morchella importuna]|uniref:uncharacterized protein n=1 Tax=Morchella importuna TaxID=1174673 RepID=UPI001E8E836E|nr:uncharacterized protein LAJ45_04066 [Morchella importuna]KAH8152072.1 hypothetical protein LAJ45_04066 [Morchella importuna]